MHAIISEFTVGFSWTVEDIYIFDKIDVFWLILVGF